MSGNEKKKNVPNQFKVDDFSTFSSSSLGQPQRSPFNQQRSPFDQNLRNGFTVWDFSPSASPSDPLGRHMSLSSEGSQLFRTPSVTSVSSSNQSENDDQYWEVLLDVSLYELDEIVVRGVENRVIVHAKHEERECGLDYVSREFSRQYVLPSNIEPETVTASLLPDGVLSLKAPKITVKPPPKERIIPIHKVAPEPPDRGNSHVDENDDDTESELDYTTATESDSSVSTDGETGHKYDVDDIVRHNGNS